jgi:hypothetical protein
MPTSTVFTYAMISLVNQNELKGQAAVDFLESNVAPKREEHPVMKVEKMKALVKIGKKYPQNIEDDLKLLEDYQLIEVDRNEGVYKYKMPIQKPEDLFEYDEEERAMVNTLRFELKHHEKMNLLLTLIVNSNGLVQGPVKHILNTTGMKINDFREIANFLIEEGSVELKSKKDISKLKKDDNVKLKIVEEVFNTKRVVVNE